MTLRLLERLTSQMGKRLVACRSWDRERDSCSRGEKRFRRRGRVTGIDMIRKRFRSAKANARLNKIDNADFQLGDVRRWKTQQARWGRYYPANLYGELLIDVAGRKLKRSNLGSFLFRRCCARGNDEVLRVLRRKQRGRSQSGESVAGEVEFAPDGTQTLDVQRSSIPDSDG